MFMWQKKEFKGSCFRKARKKAKKEFKMPGKKQKGVQNARKKAKREFIGSCCIKTRKKNRRKPGKKKSLSLDEFSPFTTIRQTTITGKKQKMRSEEDVAEKPKIK
ncbi:hypothetical protein AMTRI_Chr09g42250 [Amborella trichopoda]